MSTTMEQCLSRTTAETFERLALLVPDTQPSAEQSAAPLDVTVLVEFRGPAHGRLVLRASGHVLPSIAASMLGESERRATALQRDALGELANVICGNVLPALHDAEAVFRLEAPRAHGVSTPSRESDTPAARVVLGVEDGRVEVTLYQFTPRSREAA